jgi:hypothetical protein
MNIIFPPLHPSQDKYRDHGQKHVTFTGFTVNVAMRHVFTRLWCDASPYQAMEAYGLVRHQGCNVL